MISEHGTQTRSGKLMIISNHYPRHPGFLLWQELIAHSSHYFRRIAAPTPQLSPEYRRRVGWKSIDGRPPVPSALSYRESPYVRRGYSEEATRMARNRSPNLALPGECPRPGAPGQGALAVCGHVSAHW